MSFLAAVPCSSRASEEDAPGRALREAGGLDAMRRLTPEEDPDLDGMPDLDEGRPISERAGFAALGPASDASGFEFPIGARPGFAAGLSTAFEFVPGFELEFPACGDVGAGFADGAALFVRAAGAIGVRPTARIVVLAVDPLPPAGAIGA
jgi:hypothetical protein